MRRRWKWLVLAIVATAIAATFVFFPLNGDDGLDWIRKYDPVESSSTVTRRFTHGEGNYLVQEFRFPQGFPKALDDELMARLEKEIADFGKGIDNQDDTIIDWFPNQNLVVVERYIEKPWIVRKWMQTKKKLGLGP
jgi:hypothetical protein